MSDLHYATSHGFMLGTRQICDDRTAKDLSSSTPEDSASIDRSLSEGTIEDPTTPTAASASQQQLINQLKTKQRDQEKTIGTLKHKEVCPSDPALHDFVPFLRWNTRRLC